MDVTQGNPKPVSDILHFRLKPEAVIVFQRIGQQGKEPHDQRSPGRRAFPCPIQLVHYPWQILLAPPQRYRLAKGGLASEFVEIGVAVLRGHVGDHVKNWDKLIHTERGQPL